MPLSSFRYGVVLIGSGVLALAVIAPTQAQTTSLAYWNFNDTVLVPGTMDQAGRDAFFSADGGVNGSTAYMTTNFNFIDGIASRAGVTRGAGSTVNATLPDGSTLPAGLSLALQGGTGGSDGLVSNNGKYLEFGVSTVGFEGLVVSYSQFSNTAGFTASQFQYSVDGTNFVNFGAAYGRTPLMDLLREYDLSGIAGLANNPNAAFRIVFEGATSASGLNAIDNLQINNKPGAATAVPETGTMALLGMGTLPLLGAVVRHRRSRRA